MKKMNGKKTLKTNLYRKITEEVECSYININSKTTQKQKKKKTHNKDNTYQ